MTEHTSDGQPRPNDLLRSIIDRGERIGDEIEQAQEDMKELLAEAKSHGFNPSAIRAVLKRRNETPDKKSKREEFESVFDLYLSNLSMLD